MPIRTTNILTINITIKAMVGILTAYITITKDIIRVNILIGISKCLIGHPTKPHILTAPIIMGSMVPQIIHTGSRATRVIILLCTMVTIIRIACKGVLVRIIKDTGIDTAAGTPGISKKKVKELIFI